MTTRLSIDTAPLDAHRVPGVVVAFSGGLDSTVLLHALASDTAVRERGLRAVHVDHGLHPQAGDWASYCARACRALDVPFESVRVRVDVDGRGPEAAARDARREALIALCGPGVAVALAHHRDDQAETFLLRALRGSGPDGLAAMRAWRAFGAGWAWRPLLGSPRSALLAYARVHGLEWIEDPSNADDRLDRNFLRLHVLPLLRRRWPHADAAFAQSAATCADANRLLSAGDMQALEAARISSHELDVRELASLDPARRARVLRHWIAALGLPPLPREGVERIETALLGARPDATAEFAWHGARVRRWRRRLHAGRVSAPPPAGWSMEWSGESTLDLPDGGRLMLDAPCRFPQPVHVRARRGGERIHLPGRRHRHLLKHVLQDRAVPPWEREHLPLVFSAGGELLAAGDVAVSGALQAWLEAAGARLLWSRPHDDGR